MSKFVTKKILFIKAREVVEQLFIDDIGQLESFEESLKGTTYESEFTTLLRYIQHFADGNSIGDKVVYLKGVKDNVTEYEFKSKHLRIYAIQQPGRKIILLGGVKKQADSNDNISTFRLIKTQFIHFLKIPKK